jgi:hypothetical protein
MLSDTPAHHDFSLLAIQSLRYLLQYVCLLGYAAFYQS